MAWILAFGAVVLGVLKPRSVSDLVQRFWQLANMTVVACVLFLALAAVPEIPFSAGLPAHGVDGDGERSRPWGPLALVIGFATLAAIGRIAWHRHDARPRPPVHFTARRRALPPPPHAGTPPEE